MNKAVVNSIGIGSLWLIVVCTGLVGTAQAEEKLRVGVLDMRKVMMESKPGQQYRAELEKMVKERREKLTKEESGLKSLQEKFEKDKLVMNDKQKEQRQKEIDDKAAALQKALQEAQQQVSKRDSELSGEARNAVTEIIADVAKKEKLSMVVDRNQFVWAEEQVDITDQVAKAYEAKAK